MADAVKIINVNKYFVSLQALVNVTAAISEGAVVAVLGPDGAGKTTLLRIIASILKADSGCVEILGQRNIQQAKTSLGYMPQKFSLYQDLTVIENIELFGALYGLSTQQIHTKAEQILTFVNLWPFRHSFAGNLSGGMKQKLALAVAILHDPVLLILDEPTTGVDPVARREFWQLLYDLNLQGTTIIVATPYMDEAELCDKILMLHRGRAVSYANLTDFIANYPYIILSLKLSQRNLPEILAGCYFISLDAFGETYHVVTDNVERTQREIMDKLVAAGLTEIDMKEIKPSLEDVFILLAGDE